MSSVEEVPLKPEYKLYKYRYLVGFFYALDILAIAITFPGN